jgi:hypothetical protein
MIDRAALLALALACACAGEGDGASATETAATTSEATTPACLISCETADHCPEPGMVCVPCPEPFVSACDAFDAYPSSEPRICAWPDP